MSKKQVLSIYEQAKQLVENLEVGQVKAIQKPEKLTLFRQYITVFGKATQKKFTTKVVKDKLHVMRVEFFSF